MLYIEIKNEDGNRQTLEWSFNEEPPFDNIEDIIKDVIWIKADGEEENTILLLFQRPLGLNGFSSIPVNQNKPFQCWYGDIARTILLTLGTV